MFDSDREEIKKIKEKEAIEALKEKIEEGEIPFDERVLEFERKFLYGEKISIFLPRLFDLMNEDYVKLKYPSSNRPEILISDEDGVCVFSFNHTKTVLLKNQVEEFTKEMKGFLVKNNSSAIFEKNEEINTIEFETAAIDVEIYNLIYIYSLNNRAFFCGFSCPKPYKEGWKLIAKACFETLIMEVEDENA